MNTLTTLFSGLAAVLVLYCIFGWIRSLPPMLRALLAGLIPLVVYFVLIMGRGPGMDVVAMHISVFLAAALVLYAMTQFRQRGAGKMHWAPKLLTAFFIGLAGLNGVLLYLSTKGLPESIGRWWLGGQNNQDGAGAVYSGFSGVVSHGQNAAKAVSSELTETHHESELGWKVEFSGLENASQTSQVEVRVRDRTGLPVAQLEAELSLLRPGAATPTRFLTLPATAPGVYADTVTLPATGRWLIELRLKQGGTVQFHSIQERVAP